ncbi:MAG: HDOD domain-containing protein [candidate division Zixibacteria bacterium]|nr:HDOD domain-containing protein [candidate division Zixibacteria bacterium]
MENRPLCAKDVISRISEIGSLPQTLAAVLKTLNNQMSGAEEVAEVISKDVSLTFRVLRMVNSAQFGRRRKVTKISEAVVLMGLNSIKMLTLSSSVFGMVNDPELLRRCNIKRICRHLIETAINARSIAIETKYKEPEEAFVGGILHDIGIILMLLYFREKYLQVLDRMKADQKGITQAEKDVFGLTHGEVGAEIINSWSLPPKLAFVVENHHSPNATSMIPEEIELNNIIALADHLSLGPFDDYFPNVEENIEFVQLVGRKLNLNNTATNKIRRDSIPESIKLAEYLELDIGDILDILSEANNRLAELYFSLEKLYLEKQKLQTLVNGELIESTLESVQ